MVSKTTLAAILAALERAAKWFFRREHGKAVEEINRNRKQEGRQ